jgi:hypothetical protein
VGGALDIAGREAEFRAAVTQHPEWGLAEETSTMLAQALEMEKVSFEGTREEATPVLLAAAQQVIGIRMLRAIRAAMAVLASGYEPETRALDRVIMELLAHRRVILADPSGEEANKWLAGDSGHGITAKVNALGDDELYANLCQDAHGDPRSVQRLYDPQSETIILGPYRDPLKTRVCLLVYAGSAVDQTRFVAAGRGLEVVGIQEHVDRVNEAWTRFLADAPPPPA